MAPRVESCPLLQKRTIPLQKMDVFRRVGTRKRQQPRQLRNLPKEIGERKEMSLWPRSILLLVISFIVVGIGWTFYWAIRNVYHDLTQWISDAKNSIFLFFGLVLLTWGTLILAYLLR